MIDLNGFCEDPFWDEELTLDGSWPQFTQCFQDTALTLLPCGFLWLVAPFYSYYLARCPTSTLGNTFSKLLILRLFFLTLIIILWISLFINVISSTSSSDGGFLKASLFSPILQVITLVTVFCFTVAERERRFVTSGILFIFWCLEFIATIIPFYSYIELQEYETDLYAFVTFQVRVAFTLIQFLLYFIAEKPVSNVAVTKKPSPEVEASFPSRLSFTWHNGLMQNGFRNPLTESCMTDLHPRDKSAAAVPGFIATWNKAVSKAKERLKLKKRGKDMVRPISDSETSPLLLNTALGSCYTDEEVTFAPESKKKDQRLHPSLLCSLFKTFWADYFLSQVWKLFYDGLIICNPLLLGALVAFVDDRSTQAWKGFVFAATLFASTSLQSILLHQVFHFSNALGIRIRAAIISAVFRKALTMDSNARKESTVGEVVNLMSVDADHISMLMTYLWALWSSPLQIALCLYLLYNKIGLAMFAGAGILILLIPLNGYFTAKLGQMEAKILALKDERMKIMNELLGGIKIIKFYAWETSFEKQVLAIRNQELAVMRRLAFVNSCLILFWTVAPFLVSLLTFLVYILTSSSHHLDAETAFVAISLLNIMRFAINFAPFVITESTKAVISARRIGHFLFHDDLDADSVTRDKNASVPLSITNGTFSWNSDGEPTLKNINLSVEEDSLIAVVGTVGSGKSSLLSAILGEIKQLSGSVVIRDKVSYVPQQAWIQNDTVRNNILFGKAYHETLYQDCIEACALKPDLDILPAGDLTEIGERGINLSGGQKQRVSLARAVYVQADIYLLDDPLSAVDSHVGKHIFDKVISDSGLLRGKVRVLVTHGIQWLPQTDHIIVMTNGKISESGHYDRLLLHRGAFAQFITTYLLQDEEDENMSNNEEYQEVKRMFLRRISETEDEASLIPPMALSQENSHSSRKEKSEDQKKVEEHAKDNKVADGTSTLIEEESVESGTVKWPVVKAYAKSFGPIFLIITTLAYIGSIAANTGSLIWLGIWTDDTNLSNFTIFPANSSDRTDENNYYVSIYGVFGLMQIALCAIFSIILGLRSVEASRTLHSNMLSRILHAPMSFFDTTPTGRILNRFSKDLTEVDEELPNTFGMCLDSVMLTLASIFVISLKSPIFIAFIIPMVVLYFFIQRYFIATSRQLKRLESKTKSPIYNHFSETLTGASIIRAFGAQEEFVAQSEAKVDAYQIYAFSNYVCNRWLAVRLEFVGGLAILVASTIAVATRDDVSAGTMGLIITYALEITENVNWLVRMLSDLEKEIVCVERIKQYSEIDTEAPWEIAGIRPAATWPDKGHIRLEDLCLRYREGLDLVLKGVSLEIKPSEKVGIVGRTGAGKSSLTLALFRLVEPASGGIFIDGVDISSIGLHDLRSKITILPQDPVIFAGTLRHNLNPFDEYSDESLWKALKHAHLKDFVEGLPNKLDHECGEGGENLSIGQRQLLCLGRALLRKTKVLILDEATAAVDMETDDLIQETIREEFKDCTILTIAHRLNTIMSYDRIVVLDKGEVNDFDTPENLLSNTDGLFYSMAKTAGVVS